MRKVRIAVPFIVIIASVFLMVLIHELGHVLSSLAIGGRVVSLSLIPTGGYVAATVLDFAEIEMSFAKDLFVSAGGYVVVTVVTAVLMLISAAMPEKSIVQFSVYMAALIFSVISFGQYIYALVQTLIFLKSGVDTGSDMISTMYNYPGTEGITAIFMLGMLIISSVCLIWTAVRVKEEFVDFADIVLDAA